MESSSYVTGVPAVRTEVVQMMMDDEFFFIPLLAVIFAITICVLFRKIWWDWLPFCRAHRNYVGNGPASFLWSHPQCPLHIGANARTGHRCRRWNLHHHPIQRRARPHPKPRNRHGALHATHALGLLFHHIYHGGRILLLLVADTVVVRDFGAHAATMVMVAFVAVVLVVPCWLAFVPCLSHWNPPHKEPDGTVFLSCPRSLGASQPKSHCPWGAICSALEGLDGSDVRPNSRLLEMYTDDHPTHQAIKLSEDRLSGVVPIFIHAQADEGDLLDPNVLERLSQRRPKLRESRSRAVDPLLAQIQNIHQLLTEENRLPTDRKQISQELLMAEMSGELPSTEFEHSTIHRLQNTSTLQRCRWSTLH